MAEIGVAHLVREKNGVEPFERFISSYREHRVEVAHRLLMVFKGFDGERVPEAYRAVLDGLEYESFFVADQGFDIRPFFAVAEKFEYPYFCFLNSFSAILCPDWLTKMYGQLTRAAGVGVVGATGSYESMYSNFLRMSRSSIPTVLSSQRIMYESVRRVKAARLRAAFPGFPNQHVRTNAFLIPRGVMLKLKVGAIRTKMDAQRFETGRRSLTRQIFAMNLRALVVGRDGEGYEKERWYESRTFRSGAQSNLLVADNRTREYEDADAERKRLLSQLAWGKD